MKNWIVGLTALVVLIGVGPASGLTISPGFDLFTTTPGTAFDPDGPGPLVVPFVGVPIGTFDFGVGSVGVGTTDTIVERLAPAEPPLSGPGIDTIPIEMVSLQLVSAAPVDLGGGLAPHYVTLQSNRSGSELPGLPSTGTMEIDFDTQTFSSVIEVNFDVRIGDLAGSIVLSGADTLVNEDPIVWASSLSGGYFYAPDATERSNQIPFPMSYHKFTITRGGGTSGDDPWQIPGVNDGFFPLVIQIVPEPCTVLVWSLLAGLGIGLRWRRPRR